MGFDCRLNLSVGVARNVLPHKFAEDLRGWAIIRAAGFEEFLSKSPLNADAKSSIFPRHGAQCTQRIHKRQGTLVMGCWGGRRLPDWCSDGHTFVQGSVRVEMEFSKPRSWVQRGGEKPLCRWSAEESEVSLRGINRRNGWMAHTGSMPKCAKAGGSTGARSGLPGKVGVVLPRTPCDQRKPIPNSNITIQQRASMWLVLPLPRSAFEFSLVWNNWLRLGFSSALLVQVVLTIMRFGHIPVVIAHIELRHRHLG